MRQTILRLMIVILSSMMVATSFVACGGDEDKTPIVDPVQNEGNDNGSNDNEDDGNNNDETDNDTQGGVLVSLQAIDMGLPSGTK